MALSRITQFYFGDIPDHRGRSLDQLQTQTIDGLECCHDYIQWLFPLPERSSANPDAPRLTPSDIHEFSVCAELRANLVCSLAVMLHFFGLELLETPGGPMIRSSGSFEYRRQVWLTPFNHNFLRITRILRSLSLLGCEEHAAALFTCLEGLYRDNAATVGPDTLRYWKSALR